MEAFSRNLEELKACVSDTDLSKRLIIADIEDGVIAMQRRIMDLEEENQRLKSLVGNPRDRESL